MKITVRDLFSVLLLNAALLLVAVPAFSQPPAGATPLAHLQSGYAKYDSKDYTGAVASFSECLRLDAGNAECYSARGDAHRRLEKFSEALADYTQLLKLAPNNALAYALRAVALSSKVRAEQKASGIYDRKAYEPAIADYDTALRLDPANAQVKAASDALRNFLLESDKLAELKAKKASLEADIAERVKRIKASSAVMLMVGQFDTAIVGYSSCINSSAVADVECYVGRARAYLGKSQIEKSSTAPDGGASGAGKFRQLALADADKAVGLNARSVPALIVRGQIQAAEGAKEKAIADLRAALRIDPNSAEAKAELSKLGAAQ